ncbi:MAG: ABC transporter ATP-binding protein [Sphaerochaetaceae bacterium]|jgi:ATP-binding cassette subfamily B protein|nr:ABC transporter ATP-binding protein [Sphaerochaetaceae bacterium]
MRLLLRYLWKSRLFVLYVIVLLSINAVCNLALPSFTSRIVNIGIQQEGIQSAVFEQAGASRFNQILTMLDTSERETFANSYRHDGEVYVLDSIEDTTEIERLTVAAFSKLTGLPVELATQAAVFAIADEYRTLGIDVDAIRISYILRTGLAMLAVAFTAIGASIMVSFFSAKTAAVIGKSLRSNIFSKVLSFSRPEMDSFSTSSLITRSTNDIQQIQMSSVMLMRIVFFAPIMAIGGVLRILGVQTALAWVVGVGVLVIILIVAIMFVAVMPRFKRLQSLVDKTNLIIRERLSGLQVIRAFNTYQYEQKRFDTANRDLTKTALFVNRAMSAMMPVMMLVMNLVVVMILWNGAHHIEAGTMQVGDMMAFIQYGMHILMSFLMISMLTVMLPRAAVSGDRINEVLEKEPSIIESQNSHKTDVSKQGVVEFSHVGFTYPGAAGEALHDISFTANPGTVTAIIGSTGSGKSTVCNLLVRLYDATQGSILVEGWNIKNIPTSLLRERIAYVPQKAVLFSGSVTSNIAFGTEMESQTIQQAASVAQADQFIAEMPEGFESAISQGGANVSGGQRQRLAIARAIAKKAPVLVFDDSFSALDFQTDRRLRIALKEHMNNATVIIVAQRINTIAHADRILVLEDGKIVGDGTHRQLLKTCPVYRQIAASQLSEKEIEA